MFSQLITTQPELDEFCAVLAQDNAVAIDTEFIREKTYWPQLCLMQAAGAGVAACIDPLAKGLDLSPFWALLADVRIVKIFHAARQDIEIFVKHTGLVPTPIFDTQIAAGVLGYGESIAYDQLIWHVLRVRIDKASRFTDWSRRPLSQAQIDYALADVIHLREAYAHLGAALNEQGRAGWIEGDMAVLTADATYRSDPQDAWARLKFGNMRPRALAALQLLAAWREREAQRKDIPRGRIIRDEALLEIASSMPLDLPALMHVRGIGNIPRHFTDAILQCIEQARAMPEEALPETQRHRPRDVPKELLELLAMLQRLRGHQLGVVPRLLASKSELEDIACGAPVSRVLTGWRYAAFGQLVNDFLTGRFALRYDPQSKSITLD